MDKKRAAKYIDFADSEYVSFEMSKSEELIIFMKNWQGIPLKLTFKNVIQFFYQLGDFPKDLYELNDSAFLKEALECKYEIIPFPQPFKHYQLEDIDDYPFIQVVAESVLVTKEENNR